MKIIILIALLFFNCAHEKQFIQNRQNLCDSGIELPAFGKNQIVFHEGLTLSYSEKHEQAEWVAYKLTKTQVEGKTKRKSYFKKDSDIITQSASSSDYNPSFSKGHLKPAADSRLTKKTMAACFYMSNVSPQRQAFNTGIWRKLETQVRKWAIKYNCVYVATGPLLGVGLKRIGISTKISVPKFFYKVIFINNKRPQGIGFLIQNKRSSKSLTTYMVSIDLIEDLTGIDFFPALPDNIEEKIEGTNYLHLK